MSRDTDKGRYESPQGSSTWEYIATLSCSLLIFCVGCITGWNSPTLSILMGPESAVPLTSSEASTLTTMIALGHAVAPTFTTVMADKLGRKNSLLVTGIPIMISWGLIAVSQNIIVLLVARFIAGLAVGLIFCVPQMYLGEIATAKLRGAIGMVCGTMLNAGILFMFVIVPCLTVSKMAWLGFSLATTAVISLWFIPESPYFLAMAGKMDEAEIALAKLRGKTDVTEELELVKATTSQKDADTEDSKESQDKEAPEKLGAFKLLFSVAGNRKAIFINLFFMAVIQFGSCVIIMVYGNIILDRMKTGVSAHVCTMILGSLQLVSNILTVFVIDKIGRKPLICISGLVSGVCLLVIAVYLYLLEYTNANVTRYGILALCAVFANMVTLSFGLMPLQHVIQSEIFATEIKALATCVNGVLGGVLAVVSVKSYLMLAETWGLGHCVPFFGFVVVTWTCTALILKMLPETKGKTLYDIQRALNS